MEAIAQSLNRLALCALARTQVRITWPATQERDEAYNTASAIVFLPPQTTNKTTQKNAAVSMALA